MSKPEAKKQKTLSKANVLMVGTGYASSRSFVFVVRELPNE